MATPRQPSIEECYRTLRGVATALNVVLPDDTVTLLKSALSRRPGAKVRYFPNRHLLLVVEGIVQGENYDVVARQLIKKALADISPQAQRDCHAAVVGWVAKNGETCGAALEVSVSGEPTIVGASWQPRHLWHRPMPDPDTSPEEALNHAVELVISEVNRVLSSGKVRDRNGITGALSLCEKCFLLAEGIPPATSRSLPQEPTEWPAWLEDFRKAAEAECMRLFPNEDANNSELLDSKSSSGLLSGVRVFLSYAMPTNVEFARPVMRALQLQGAEVWFDQSARPNVIDLDQGLRAVIAAQDVFLFCASCELFENAGYALQELAWVLDLQGNDKWSGRICVVLLDDVLLPRALNSADIIDLSNTEAKYWPKKIVDLVTRDPASAPCAPKTISSRVTLRSGVYDEMSLQSLRLRFRHAMTWWNFDENSVTRSLAGNLGRGSSLSEFGNLNRLISDLGWDGSLATYDTWPLDPAVRDVRVRLGCLRFLFLVTSLDLVPDNVQKIRADMEFLAERLFPLSDEAAVSGWDDEERRFGIRHHLGILTRLAELLRRGLAVGLICNYASEQCDQWERSIADRRRDCGDRLLELRREERLHYKDRAIRWDRTCHAFDRFLYEGTEQWKGPIPSWVQFGLGGARIDVSALFADVVWRASRSGAGARRLLLVPCGDGDVQMEITAVPSSGTAVPHAVERGRSFALEACLNSSGAADIRLSWWDDRKMGPNLARGYALPSEPIQLVR